MTYAISAINVWVNQSPKYPPGEHGRCSRERRVLCELCAASYSEVRGRRPEGIIPLPLVFVDGLCHAGSCMDHQQDSNHRGARVYNSRLEMCLFHTCLSIFHLFSSAKLEGNSVNIFQMKHCKLTWEQIMLLRPRNSPRGKFPGRRRTRKGSPASKASFEELPLPFKTESKQDKNVS